MITHPMITTRTPRTMMMKGTGIFPFDYEINSWKKVKKNER
jgi:hypothetical protein